VPPIVTQTCSTSTCRSFSRASDEGLAEGRDAPVRRVVRAVVGPRATGRVADVTGDRDVGLADDEHVDVVELGGDLEDPTDPGGGHGRHVRGELRHDGTVLRATRRAARPAFVESRAACW
jgi:hypothetical protein